jgi:hypothetical protein
MRTEEVYAGCRKAWVEADSQADRLECGAQEAKERAIRARNEANEKKAKMEEAAHKMKEGQRADLEALRREQSNLNWEDMLERLRALEANLRPLVQELADTLKKSGL